LPLYYAGVTRSGLNETPPSLDQLQDFPLLRITPPLLEEPLPRGAPINPRVEKPGGPAEIFPFKNPGQRAPRVSRP